MNARKQLVDIGDRSLTMKEEKRKWQRIPIVTNLHFSAYYDHLWYLAVSPPEKLRHCELCVSSTIWTGDTHLHFFHESLDHFKLVLLTTICNGASSKLSLLSSFTNHSLISNYRSWVLFPLECIATYLSWISRRFQTQTRGWVVARNRLWHWSSESIKWAALNPRYVSICKAICKALKAHEIYNNWGSTFLFRDCKKCSDRFSRWG